MSITRAAFRLAAPLFSAALVVAAAPDPVLPMDTAWTRPFPFGDQFLIAVGETRLLVVEPTRIAAHAWKDGAPAWVSDLDATVVPVIDEGRVFIAAEEQLHALSEMTGVLEWRLPTGPVSIAPTARSGWLIVASETGTLTGVNASLGRVVWTAEIGVPLTSPVSIDGDLVVAGLADGRVTGWRVTDGSARWETKIGTRSVQVLAAAGRVFIAGQDGRLICLRQRDGRQEWDYLFGMAVVGRLAVDDRHIYATTIDNSVRGHAFNGHQKWRQVVDARVVDGLIADAGRIFVPQSNGEIRIFTSAGEKAGRLPGAAEDASVLGGLASSGGGSRLRMAITNSAASELTVTAYQPTGLPATVAATAPPGTPLVLDLPPVRR